MGKTVLSEKTLGESEDQFRSIYNHIGIGIALISRDMEILSLNPQMQRWFPHIDVAKRHICYRTFNIPPRDSVCEYCPTIQTLRDGKVHSAVTDTPTPDGIRNYQIVATPMCAPDGTVVSVIEMVEDVTERIRTEERIRESEARLTESQRIAKIGSWSWDLLRNTLYWSAETYRRFDKDPATFVTSVEYFVHRIHPDDRTAIQRAIERSLEQDAPYHIQSRIINESGREWVLEGFGVVERDADGKPVRFAGTAQDITDRQQLQEALRAGKELLRSVVESSADAIFVKDADGKYILINHAGAAFIGKPAADIIGSSDADLFSSDNAAAMREQDRHIVESAQTVMYEHEIKLQTGPRMMQVRKGPLRDQQGRVIGVYGISRDITVQRRAEESLRLSEHRLAESERMSHVGSWEHNPKTNAIWWSGELFRLLGLDPAKDKAEFELFFSRIHPDDQPLLKSAIETTLREKKPFDVEYRFVMPGGAVKVLHARADLVPDADGDRSLLRGTAQDITERKHFEEALRRSEERFRLAMLGANDGLWDWDLETDEVYYSPRWKSMLGYGPDELGHSLDTWKRLVHPDDQDRTLHAVRDLLEGRSSKYEVEFRMRHRDGSLRHILSRAYLSDAKGTAHRRLVGTHVDITERKRYEEELLRSRQWLQLHVEQTPLAVVEFDLEGRFRGWNAAAERVFGYSRQEAIGKHWHMIVPPEVRGQLDGIWEGLVSQRGGFRSSNRNYTKDYRIIECEWFNTPLRDGAGKTIGVASLIMDVTDRKRAEEQIRESERFIRSILDTVDEGFIVIDRDFRILTANKAYCAQAGLPCDEVIGRNCYAISHKAARPCYEEGEDCSVRHVFATGEPHSVLHKHQDGDGNVLYVETKAFPVRDEAGNVTSAIETINNITEKHLLEEERLKTQKLESIGTLAGGIAHDFNNLLQGVFGYISMAKLSADDRTKCIASLDEAENALHLTVKLTSQLLTFSKGGKPVKEPMDIRPLISSAVRFALSGSRTSSRIATSADLWYVDADDGQISQVIQNVVLNADQAMPQGGTVEIEARNVDAPGDGLPPGLAAGRYVEIAIRDSGVGIPEKYLSRIFDPYFTTKEKGSGLGLATSYSIVRNHGGSIDVRSAVGSGSVFRLYLPAVLAASESAADVPVPGPVRQGRILVMDDEEIVRKITARLLEALGHSAEFVPNGEGAVDRYRTAMDAGTPFDVVILDLTVRGGMGGTETMQRLQEIDPSVKAVVSSGYSDEGAVADFQARGFRSFLQKPYDIKDLQRTLASLLD